MSWVVGLPNNSYKPITNTAWVRALVDDKKGALDSQSQVIKFTSCLPMVGGSLWVLRLLPPLKLMEWKTKEVFGSWKPKGPKQDTQQWVRSPMSDGENLR
jgi:hypothetical protein